MQSHEAALQRREESYVTTPAAPQWREIYEGGSQEAEKKIFDALCKDIHEIRRRVAGKTGRNGLRTLHAKILVGVRNAVLHIDDDLPIDFATGYFRPGKRFAVTARISNASPVCSGDAGRDMRGVVLRLDLEDGRYHDLLMTSYPVSHARDAKQFIEVAKIATGPKALILPRLFYKLGLAETRRIIANIKAGSRAVESVASLQFWSRAALLWGDAGPVRYTLRPLVTSEFKKPNVEDPNYLANEFAARLLRGEIRYRFALQRFVDEETTPIEDGSVEWRESDSPFVEVATLVIPQQDLRSDEARTVSAAVDGLAFNPWNCPPPFRPLGNLNRARGPVYAASAAEWLGSSQ
jgi:Catalase